MILFPIYMSTVINYCQWIYYKILLTQTNIFRRKFFKCSRMAFCFRSDYGGPCI